LVGSANLCYVDASPFGITFHPICFG